MIQIIEASSIASLPILIEHCHNYLPRQFRVRTAAQLLTHWTQTADLSKTK